jgi:hypothetical protein
MGRDEIAVGNIPGIKGEFAAIGCAEMIGPARRQSRLVLKAEDAFHHQAAARATPQALTRTLRQACAHVTRTEQVQEKPPRRAPQESQLGPYAQQDIRYVHKGSY